MPGKTTCIGMIRTIRRQNEKINCLIKSIDAMPFEGIGKPEALRFELQGKWSRRITREDRLVYSIDGETIAIFSCRDHY